MDDLLKFEKNLGIDHVCIVAYSVYGRDNRSIIDALERLKGKGRGIVAIDAETITDAELDQMHEVGVRGVRFNLKTWLTQVDKEKLVSQITTIANKIRRLNWVLQLYLALDQFALLYDVIPTLGISVVVDHIGHPYEDVSPDQQTGYKEILSLLKNGHIYAKLSGLYRFPLTPKVDEYVKEILATAPDQVVFATDWPHAGGVENNPNGDRHAYQDYLKVDIPDFISRVKNWCGNDEKLIKKLFVDNPRRLWRYENDD